jgi:hypothetical protein
MTTASVVPNETRGQTEGQRTRHKCTRDPTTPGVRLMLEDTDIIQRDRTQHIDALLLLASLAWACGNTFNRPNSSLILEAHVHRNPAEDARGLDGWLSIYKQAVAAEDVRVQREG